MISCLSSNNFCTSDDCQLMFLSIDVFGKHVIFLLGQLPGPSSRHMSFKRERKCSKFEHHEGALPLGNNDEKPPMENGDIILTNVVSKNFE